MDALIARTEADEREAGFGARVAENQRRVFQIAYGILGNPADAEEVAQEAFLRAFQKLVSGVGEPHRLSSGAEQAA